MTEIKYAKPIKKLIDLKIVIDPPRNYYGWWGISQTQEDRAKELESWAKELEDFIKDHRSHDPVYISVEKDIKEVCNLCENLWEPCTEDGITYCAYCGVDVGKIK